MNCQGHHLMMKAWKSSFSWFQSFFVNYFLVYSSLFFSTISIISISIRNRSKVWILSDMSTFFVSCAFISKTCLSFQEKWSREDRKVVCYFIGSSNFRVVYILLTTLELKVWKQTYFMTNLKLLGNQPIWKGSLQLPEPP